MKIIADGDSNIMSSVIERVRFGRNVKKVECANHAVRRYSRALEKLSKDTRRFTGKQGILARKHLSSRLPRLAIGARSAIKNHAVPFNISVSSEILEKLKNDFRNGPEHVFGNHKKCGQWCTRKDLDPDDDVLSEVEACGLLSAIQQRVERIIIAAVKTLIYNATNNSAEHFMSQLAKTYGGKRVDFSRSGGIIRRSGVAALAFQNKGQSWHPIAQKRLLNKSPSAPKREFVLKWKKTYQRKLKAKRLFIEKCKTRKTHKSKIGCGAERNYGENASVPDIDSETMEEQSQHFLKTLAVKESDELEQATQGQNENGRWREERCKRPSSSNFKAVASGKACTPTQNLVKRLLYPRGTIRSAGVQHGIKNEATARKKYSEVCQHTDSIKIGGLFVDPENLFLCTSPDALVGVQGLLEIKCPYTAVSTSTIEEAQSKHNIGVKLNKKTNKWYLPKSHTYFYQIQGQLEISNREWCDLFVWSPSDYVIIRIARDRAFWATILPKLKKFYLEVLLPELIDPRVIRGLPTR